MRLSETYLSRKPPKPTKGVILLFYLALIGASLWAWRMPLSIDRFTAIPALVFGEHQYWRVFTSLFVHLDFDHLAANTLPFLLLTHVIVGYFGAGVYTAVFLGVGTITQGITVATYGNNVALLGASGAIYALAGFWLVLQFLVDRRFSVSHRSLRTVGVILALLFPTQILPHVSYRAHAIGFVCGAFAGGLYFLARKEKLRGYETWVVDPVEEIPDDSVLPS